MGADRPECRRGGARDGVLALLSVEPRGLPPRARLSAPAVARDGLRRLPAPVAAQCASCRVDRSRRTPDPRLQPIVADRFAAIRPASEAIRRSPGRGQPALAAKPVIPERGREPANPESMNASLAEIGAGDRASQLGPSSWI